MKIDSVASLTNWVLFGWFRGQDDMDTHFRGCTKSPWTAPLVFCLILVQIWFRWTQTLYFLGDGYPQAWGQIRKLSASKDGVVLSLSVTVRVRGGDPGVTSSGGESCWAPADCWDTKIGTLSVRSFDVSKEALSPNNYMQCPDFKMVAWFCKNPVQAKQKYISGPKSALVLTVCDFNNQKNEKALASGVIFSLHYVNEKKAKGCLTLRSILVSLHYLGPLLGPLGLLT